MVLKHERPPRRARVLPVVFVAALVLADAAAAWWAERALATPVRVTDWFYLSLHHNDGLYLGTLPVERVWPLYLLVVGAGGIWLARKMVTSGSRVVRIGFALVLSGLICNALSMMRGSVPDYFAIGPMAEDLWLFFNAADVAIVVGLLILSGAFVRAAFR